MTIGEGIARGGSAYLDRQEKARQFDASLREKAREADQQAAVSLANHPRDTTQERLSEQAREFDASLAEKQRQFDASNKWDDALNQQRIDTLRSQQEENNARMAHYQQLEEQTRQAAADLKNERTSTMKGLFWLSRRNGGMTVSPEVLADFAKNMKAPDLVSINTAGFFYNEDGTVKIPKTIYNSDGSVRQEANDDGKEPIFGISYSYIDPNTGKIAIDKNGKNAERIYCPNVGMQREWIDGGDIFDPGSISSSYGRRSVGGRSSGSALDIAEMKQEGFALKNKYNFLEKFLSANPGFYQEWQKDRSGAKTAFNNFLSDMIGEGSAGHSVTQDSSTAPTAASTIEQFRRGRAQPIDKPVRGVGGGAGEKTTVPAPVKTPKPTDGTETGGHRVGSVSENYGLRNDGKTYKGNGWLGELKTADGGVATEYTSQSDAVTDENGNRIDFPTLVPTLTKDEIDLMVNDIIPNRKPVPDGIMQKAVDHALKMQSEGRSVFANDGNGNSSGNELEFSFEDLKKMYPKVQKKSGESDEDFYERLYRIALYDRNRKESFDSAKDMRDVGSAIVGGVSSLAKGAAKSVGRKAKEAASIEYQKKNLFGK